MEVRYGAVESAEGLFTITSVEFVFAEADKGVDQAMVIGNAFRKAGFSSLLGVSRDTKSAEDKAFDQPNHGHATEYGPKPETRVRPTATSAASPSTVPAASEVGSAPGATAPTARVRPTPQATASEPLKASSVAAEGSTATVTTRTRPGAANPANPTQDTPSEAAPAASARTRSRPGSTGGLPTSAPPSPSPPTMSATKSPSDEKITDADLSKACSEAARKITPVGVTQFIAAKWGAIASVGMVAAGDRRRFLDELAAHVKAES